MFCGSLELEPPPPAASARPRLVPVRDPLSAEPPSLLPPAAERPRPVPVVLPLADPSSPFAVTTVGFAPFWGSPIISPAPPRDEPCNTTWIQPGFAARS